MTAVTVTPRPRLGPASVYDLACPCGWAAVVGGDTQTAEQTADRHACQERAA